MTRKITIPIKSGLHLWEMAELSRIAVRYNCQISIQKSGVTSDAKKFVDVLILNETKGNKLEITTYGADEEEAISAIRDFAVGKFSGKIIQNSPERQRGTR
jgi:phosphocarrier protein